LASMPWGKNNCHVYAGMDHLGQCGKAYSSMMQLR
jgi:hypothetical protein